MVFPGTSVPSRLSSRALNEVSFWASYPSGPPPSLRPAPLSGSGNSCKWGKGRSWGSLCAEVSVLWTSETVVSPTWHRYIYLLSYRKVPMLLGHSFGPHVGRHAPASSLPTGLHNLSFLHPSSFGPKYFLFFAGIVSHPSSPGYVFLLQDWGHPFFSWEDVPNGGPRLYWAASPLCLHSIWSIMWKLSASSTWP